MGFEEQQPGESPDWKHVIGIVGGMGPLAHIELERKILVATAKRLQRPVCDQDYPPWILASIPATPDRSVAILRNRLSPLAYLKQSLARLEGGRREDGADFAIIACITAHYYLEALCRDSPMPILDVVGETVAALKQQIPPGSTVGILASTGTLQGNLYPNAIARSDAAFKAISLLDCSAGDIDGATLQDRLVMDTVYGPIRDGRRMSGGLKACGLLDDRSETATEQLTYAVEILRKHGAESVVLACTELPLALDCETIHGVRLIDPIAVAADCAIAIALGERPLPAPEFSTDLGRVNIG